VRDIEDEVVQCRAWCNGAALYLLTAGCHI
jgi:hypothetical protein